jgi:hypothetical protein
MNISSKSKLITISSIFIGIHAVLFIINSGLLIYDIFFYWKINPNRDFLTHTLVITIQFMMMIFSFAGSILGAIVSYNQKGMKKIYKIGFSLNIITSILFIVGIIEVFRMVF